MSNKRYFHCVNAPFDLYFRLLLGVWIVLLLCSCSSLPIADPPLPQPVPEDVRSATAITEAAQMNEEWVVGFAAYIQNEQKKAHIPGLALAVVNSDGPLLLQGHGLRDVEKKLPVDADTLFHIGSTHKSMTALLVATLVDAGALDWDTPVVKIAPDFSLSDADTTKAVTFRHLLSMTSGIPDEAEEYLPDEPILDDVFDVAAKTELLGMPGEVFSYSNISASLAGYLAVLAADGNAGDLHDGYARLLRQRILDPLGMTSATVYVSEARRNSNHSLSYDTSGGTPETLESEDTDDDVLAPAGSLKASAREMALYMQMLVKGGVAPNGTRIVSEAALAEMWTPLLEEYGMGWEIVEVDGLRLVSHTGAYDGFVSVIGLLPDAKVGFVLLVNAEEGGGELTDDAAYQFAEYYKAR